MVRGLARVTRAWVAPNSGGFVVQTVGTDLTAAMGLSSVEWTKCTSTSVRDTLRALGVEAATRAAEREVKRIIGNSVVNRRHLSLFADFMLRIGTPLAFSRHGLRASGDGPLNRALFETPSTILAEAALNGANDDLTSLLVQIFTGNVLRVGTGSFDVLYDAEASERATRSRVG